MKNKNTNPYANQSLSLIKNTKSVVCFDLLHEDEKDQLLKGGVKMLENIEFFALDDFQPSPLLTRWKQFRQNNELRFVAKPVEIMTEQGKQARYRVEVMDGNHTVTTGHYTSLDSMAKQTLPILECYMQAKAQAELEKAQKPANPLLMPTPKLVPPGLRKVI